MKIQSVVRMYQTRYHIGLQASVVCQIAAIVIQMKVRCYLIHADEDASDVRLTSPLAPLQIDSVNIAASRIQSLWRRYCNRKIFFFYKSLVLEKLRGAPSDILRHIIPREIDLLDRAAGIHVRFRLGGQSFPPKVCFKIFTHRGVCDVGAFAPRHYKLGMPHSKAKSSHTKRLHYSPSNQQKMRIRVGSSFFNSVTDDANMMEDWYIREENNFWRPIAENTLLDAFACENFVKPIKQSFHYSKLYRKHDVEILRKRRKREWMAKAYRLAKECSFGDLGTKNSESKFSCQDGYEGKFDEKQDDDDVVKWR